MRIRSFVIIMIFYFGRVRRTQILGMQFGGQFVVQKASCLKRLERSIPQTAKPTVMRFMNSYSNGVKNYDEI